jgi:tRNA pseudouridine38-40 synthase
MKHLLLTITYDGAGFHGWQRQPGQRTVQGELERVLSILCKEEITIAGASRTDAGVHAYGQRAGFSGDFGIPVEKLALAANRLMDKDVRILEVLEVSEGFHPRFDATGKTYIYKIRNSREPDVMMRNFHYHVEKPLNLTAMQEAATYLAGEQDFRSFLAAGGKEPETTVRRITSAECYLDESCVPRGTDTEQNVVFEVTGSGFLYNMVRIITGTLVEIGLGKRSPADMKMIIDGRDRRRAGHTAPPQGLYLKEVYYKGENTDENSGPL